VVYYYYTQIKAPTQLTFNGILRSSAGFADLIGGMDVV
jgi:hypothetical protein